jgi:hypothetical protein
VVVGITVDPLMRGFAGREQAVSTALKDGSTVIFSSTDWEHPGSKDWKMAPYYSFTSGTMTYECKYTNNGSNANNTIVAGNTSSYFHPRSAA